MQSPVTEDKPPGIEDRFQALLSAVASVRSDLSKVHSQLKDLEKFAKKEVKLAQGKKATTTVAKRKPTGFAVPGPISAHLAGFLGTSGDKLARTEVTKGVVAYIKENGLQNPDNKRVILPDAKLKLLLDCSSDDEVTYFNLQKFLNHHFV